MLATATTLSLLGLEAHLVRVEVESTRGPGSFDLVGLAEASVRESRVRVRSALAQLDILLDEHRVVVNLAPGDLRKTGSGFDLAIALATLAALGIIPAESIEEIVLLGELSLTGELRPIRGVLPQLLSARRQGFTRALVPLANGREAAVVRGVTTRVAKTLEEIVKHLTEGGPLAQATVGAETKRAFAGVDMAEVRGQASARRALEIAAAGHHHVLMMGPPGGGKTMLARRLPTIMPPLTEEEALEASAVHSIAGLLPGSLLDERPFRAPHHTVSDAGLVGGGLPIRPGELSLAHHGVLFLDELPEFRRSTLEALRQPLEDGTLVIARARGASKFPARPLVIAASNPCPCGHAGTARCACAPDRVRSYLARLSGPLLDRLDIHIALPAVAVSDLAESRGTERSADIRARVCAARALQTRRRDEGVVTSATNSALGPADIEAVATPDADGKRLLVMAAERLGLSARGYTRVLRVARTIADLAEEPNVHAAHIAEALILRAPTARATLGRAALP